MKDYGLLLKTAREAQGLTQEQAAEEVGVSVDSWYAYEANKRLPSRETVSRICDALDAPGIAVAYLEITCGALGVLPELHERELPTAVLTLLNRVLEFNERCRARQLLAIAEDGVIDAAERDDYDAIVQDLDGIIEAALAVKYPKGIKKNRSDAGTSKRLVSRPESKNDRKIILAHRSGKINPIFAREGGASL